MKIISMCVWRRPDIARKTLDALSHCTGVGDYRLLVHIDGEGSPEMPGVFNSVTFMPVTVFVADRHLGCNESTKRILAAAFEHTDYVIHDEEDILLAPDALRYFEWAQKFHEDPSILTVGAWRHNDGWLAEHGPFPDGAQVETKVSKSACFHCWGWATWGDRWKKMLANWTGNDDQTLSWDVALECFRIREGLFEVSPHISRAFNIGHGGIHRDDAWLSYWAGSGGFQPPETFRIV
jgi:hypothetical protein